MKNLEKIIKKYSEINHNEENFEIGDFVQLPTGVQGHIKKNIKFLQQLNFLTSSSKSRRISHKNRFRQEFATIIN